MPTPCCTNSNLGTKDLHFVRTLGIYHSYLQVEHVYHFFSANCAIHVWLKSHPGPRCSNEGTTMQDIESGHPKFKNVVSNTSSLLRYEAGLDEDHQVFGRKLIVGVEKKKRCSIEQLTWNILKTGQLLLESFHRRYVNWQSLATCSEVLNICLIFSVFSALRNKCSASWRRMPLGCLTKHKAWQMMKSWWRQHVST